MKRMKRKEELWARNTYNWKLCIYSLVRKHVIYEIYIYDIYKLYNRLSGINVNVMTRDISAKKKKLLFSNNCYMTRWNIIANRSYKRKKRKKHDTTDNVTFLFPSVTDWIHVMMTHWNPIERNMLNGKRESGKEISAQG